MDLEEIREDEGEGHTSTGTEPLVLAPSHDAGGSAAVLTANMRTDSVRTDSTRDKLSAASTEADGFSSAGGFDSSAFDNRMPVPGSSAADEVATPLRTLSAVIERTSSGKKESFRRVMSVQKQQQEIIEAADNMPRLGSSSSRQALKMWSTEPISLTHRPSVGALSSVGSLRRASTETSPSIASRRSSTEARANGESSPYPHQQPPNSLNPRRRSSGGLLSSRRDSAENFVDYEPRPQPPSLALRTHLRARQLLGSLRHRLALSFPWHCRKVSPATAPAPSAPPAPRDSLLGVASFNTPASPDCGDATAALLPPRRANSAVSRAASQDSRRLSAGEMEIANLTEWNTMLKENYVGCTTATGDRLNQQMKGLKGAMSRASADSVLMTSSPIAAAACKKRFQLLFLLVAGYIFYTGASNLSMTLPIHYTDKYYALRFTALALRNGNPPAEHGPGVLRVGPMLTGRPVVDEPSWSKTEGAALTVVYEDGQNLNGWWFTTTSNPVDLDPVKFRLDGCTLSLSEGGCAGLGREEGAKEGGEGEGGEKEEGEVDNGTLGRGWEKVGSSSMDTEEDLYFETTRKRGGSHRFDFQAIFYAKIVFIVAPFILGASFLGAAASGMFGYEVYAKWVVATAAVVTLLLHFTSSLLLASEDLYESAQLGYIYSGCLAIFVLLLCFWERWVVQLTCILAGIVFLADQWLDEHVTGAVALGFGEHQSDELWASVWGTFLVVFGISIHAMRYYMLARSRMFILKDKRRYDSAWQDLLKQAGAPEFLERLAEKAKALPRARNRSAKGPQQVNSNKGKYSKRDLSKNVKLPIQSLDQLYAQAAGLDIVLRKRVQGWAGASGGMFQLLSEKKAYIEAQSEAQESKKPGAEFARWEDICDDPEKVERVKWAKIKSVERAMEKLLRSYGGDVSRLLDVCRQSIIFESIPDMHACLEAILRDIRANEVEVVRVKNRMDTHYCSGKSAGYRDIAINLRIKTAETNFLGIDQHICELQLILSSFAELKNDEGHRRYVRFRNARGE